MMPAFDYTIPASVKPDTLFHSDLNRRLKEDNLTFLTTRSRLTLCAPALVCIALAADAPSQKITSPKDALGFEIGDDYRLATYTQLTAWWKKLASESDRMKLVEIGSTEEGRPQLMAILTSPENHRKLAR